MSRRVASLEEISENYPIILVDTSALHYSLMESEIRHKTKIHEKISNSESGCNSSIFYNEFIENGGNFYITSEILDEFSRSSYYNYKKRIKKGMRTENTLKLHRTRRNESKSIRNLIKTLKSSEKILELNESERKLYDKISRRYSFLKRKIGISEADFDFLISGAVVSMRRNLTSLISNDFGILYSWREVLKKEKLTPEQLGFFVRKNFNVFKRGKPYG